MTHLENVFCHPIKTKQLLQDDPHTLPNFTFKCNRTSNEVTGFGLKPNKKLQRDPYTRKYEKQYLLRLANGCSIGHTPSSPGSGDCGCHLLGYLIANSSAW